MTLTFLEPSQTAGARVFDVLTNTQTVFKDFDVAASAGGALVPVTRSFSADVAGGGLELTFKSKTGKAIVSTIDAVG